MIISKTEELQIYRNLLINLNTCRWTHNVERVTRILNAIGDYSYARTNSNGDEKQEKKARDATLLKLKTV